MYRAAAATIALLWFSAAFAAQEFPRGEATVLAFDVVSIKSLDGIARSRLPGSRQSLGRFARAATTVRQLVQYAYDLQPLQVTGGPAWVSTSRFQVDARTERTTTPQQMRAMVRQMLAERFALKAHTDVRERPITAPRSEWGHCEQCMSQAEDDDLCARGRNRKHARPRAGHERDVLFSADSVRDEATPRRAR